MAPPQLAAALGVCLLAAAADGQRVGRKSKQQVYTQNERRHSFPVQHSFDGTNWSPKGSLVVGEQYQAWFEPEFESWAEDQAENIKNAQTYYVRVASAPAETVPEGDFVGAQLAVAPCQLANAGMFEHYRVTFAPHDDDKKWVVGIAPFGTAYAREHSPDLCKDRSAFLSRVDKLVGAEHRVIMADRPPLNAPVFSKQDKGEALFQQPTNKQTKPKMPEGGEKEDEQKKSFFEKYWMYILIFMFVMMLQNQQPDPQGAQGGRQGGGGGGAAAPAQGGGRGPAK